MLDFPSLLSKSLSYFSYKKEKPVLFLITSSFLLLFFLFQEALNNKQRQIFMVGIGLLGSPSIGKLNSRYIFI